ELARQYGRYGYRKIAELLRRAGWTINDKRVERGHTMLTTTVNFPTRRAPSPQIRARDTLNDSAANGSAGVNSAPDLGGQRCRDHEDRGDSTNYRKLAEHKIATCQAFGLTPAQYAATTNHGRGRPCLAPRPGSVGRGSGL